MSWSIFGDDFGVQVSGSGKSISIEARCHHFLPTIEMEKPAFEIAEVLSISNLPVQLSLNSGGRQRLNRIVHDVFRTRGESNPEIPVDNPIGLVSFEEDSTNIEIYLDDDVVEDLVPNFFSFGSLGGRKAIAVRFGSRIIAGSRALGIDYNASMKVKNGELPGIIWNDWCVEFMVGQPVPNKLSEFQLVKALTTQNL